ncbi:putative Rubrerythrin [Desulfosarcina cetonica]|uniref:ferritin-like domain-containing protein n=1 Tax=Desulfosarcina cetonica TaxID=90730 RepID=UPI0006D1421B|nr:ferritin family protein [Desulfosarcina cetonica]VTR65610.1 putative Rubrerythrin [Desulfosarcina cetonica]
MAVIFSAREIAAAAVEKEKMRRAFYQSVADLTPDEKLKALFTFLKSEEDNHVHEFEQIRDHLPEDKEHPEEYVDEMEAYMDSVIDDRLYADIDSEAFVRKALGEGNALDLAIGFEKDAILYFREFLPFLNDSDRKIVEKLIEEEKGHIRKLAEMKKQMAG